MMRDVSKIYLVGFMGAGKSTVGDRLADRLEFEFRDLDEMIEGRTGKTIPQIFRDDGEDRFRELETETLREQSQSSKPLILATGGGVPANEKNRRILEESGTTIYLDVDFDVIYERVQEGEHRPLVPDGEEAYDQLRSLWEDRQSCYREADFVVSLSDESPETVVRELQNRLSNSIEGTRTEQ